MELFYGPRRSDGVVQKERVIAISLDPEAVYERFQLHIPFRKSMFLGVNDETVVGVSVRDDDVVTYDKSDGRTIHVGEACEYHVVSFGDAGTFNVLRIELCETRIEFELNRYELRDDPAESARLVDYDIREAVEEILAKHLCVQGSVRLTYPAIRTMPLPGEGVSRCSR